MSSGNKPLPEPMFFYMASPGHNELKDLCDLCIKFFEVALYNFLNINEEYVWSSFPTTNTNKMCTYFLQYTGTLLFSTYNLLQFILANIAHCFILRSLSVLSLTTFGWYHRGSSCVCGQIKLFWIWSMKCCYLTLFIPIVYNKFVLKKSTWIAVLICIWMKW